MLKLILKNKENFDYFSIFVFLFDKSSAKVPLRAKRGDELEPTNNETLPTSTTEEGKSANNSTTTEGNIKGNEDKNEEEKAKFF